MAQTIKMREEFPKSTPESQMKKLVALRLKAGCISSDYHAERNKWILESVLGVGAASEAPKSVAARSVVDRGGAAKPGLLFAPDSVFLQRFLRAGGYYKHDIDGLIGPQTEGALALFEADSHNVGEELGRFDPRTEATIATLLVPTQRAARKFMNAAGSAGLSSGLQVRLISGTRTFAQQDELFAQGRTKKGSIVTNARGGQSNHNFGIAWDVGIFTSSGQYIDGLSGSSKMPAKAVDAEYDKLGPVGKRDGLFWGGDWRKPDRPHYQMLDNDELPAIRDHFLHGGEIL